MSRAIGGQRRAMTSLYGRCVGCIGMLIEKKHQKTLPTQDQGLSRRFSSRFGTHGRKLVLYLIPCWFN